MKMIEIHGKVNNSGQLVIPAQAMYDMGFAPGDPVKLSFIESSDAGVANRFNEFAITRDGISCIPDDNEAELTLPLEILEKAEIPYNSDLEVVCTKGAVVIIGADPLDSLPGELRELFEELGINQDTVREVLRNGGICDE